MTKYHNHIDAISAFSRLDQKEGYSSFTCLFYYNDQAENDE